MKEPPAPEPAATEPEEEGPEGPIYQLEEQTRQESHPEAFNGDMVKGTLPPLWQRRKGKPKGRPSKAQIKAEKKLKAIKVRTAPPPGVPVKPVGWGGKRSGAGRPKRVGPPKSKLAMVRMDRALAERLEALPKGARSEYVRAALDLLSDIQPPENFLVVRRKNEQT